MRFFGERTESRNAAAIDRPFARRRRMATGPSQRGWGLSGLGDRI